MCFRPISNHIHIKHGSIVLWFFLSSFVPLYDKRGTVKDAGMENSQAQQEGHALTNALGSYLLVAHSRHDQ